MHLKAIIEFSIAGKIAANPLHPSPIRSNIHCSATFRAVLRNGKILFRSIIFRHPSIRMKNCFSPAAFVRGTLVGSRYNSEIPRSGGSTRVGL
jgi:hypothetical protein